MLKVYFGILVCLNGPCQKGQEIIGNKPYYSINSCEIDEKLIAQAMYVKNKSEYGYYCKEVEYNPPKLEQK